jgi:hypothetical protein
MEDGWSRMVNTLLFLALVRFAATLVHTLLGHLEKLRVILANAVWCCCRRV